MTQPNQTTPTALSTELLTRVAEQQSVETAYAMEEATEEEMFTATRAVYAAARRLSQSLPKGQSE